SSPSGTRRSTARNGLRMTRGLMPCCTAIVYARSVDCRRCAKPPWLAKMTAKMTTMSERNPESIAMKEGVRAPRLGQIADGLVTAVGGLVPRWASPGSRLLVLWLSALVPPPQSPPARRLHRWRGRRSAGAALGARRHRHVVGRRELERPHRGAERISQAAFRSVAARAIPPLRPGEVGDPRFSRVLGHVADRLLGARAHAWSDV